MKKPNLHQGKIIEKKYFKITMLIKHHKKKVKCTCPGNKFLLDKFRNNRKIQWQNVFLFKF